MDAVEGGQPPPPPPAAGVETVLVAKDTDMLEVPTYASAADDPAVCIGAFKEARATREENARQYVLNIGMTWCFVGILGAAWLNNNILNPLREEVILDDGTTIHRLTATGRHAYFAFFVINNVSLAAMMTVPVNYDELLCQVVWKDLFAGGRLPIRAAMLYMLVTFIFCTTADNIGLKYGLPSIVGIGFSYAQFIVVGRCQFAPHVAEGEGRHPLLRRLTMLEFLVLYYTTFSIL